MQLTSLKHKLGFDNSLLKIETGRAEAENSLEKGSTFAQEDEDESKYPPFRTVVISMLSIYAAFFLTALVSVLIKLWKSRLANVRIRTARLSELPYPLYQMNSTVSTTSPGTSLHSCSPFVFLNSPSAQFMYVIFLGMKETVT
jgi:hypothetical protein